MTTTNQDLLDDADSGLGSSIASPRSSIAETEDNSVGGSLRQQSIVSDVSTSGYSDIEPESARSSGLSSRTSSSTTLNSTVEREDNLVGTLQQQLRMSDRSTDTGHNELMSEPGRLSSRTSSLSTLCGTSETDDDSMTGPQQQEEQTRHDTYNDRFGNVTSGRPGLSSRIIHHDGRASRPSSCLTPKPAPREQQKFEIFVKYFGGSPATFKVSDTTRVEDLKEVIAKDKRIGFPKAQQRLLFQGLDMQDGRTLVSYGVKEHSEVNCTGRLRGGER